MVGKYHFASLAITENMGYGTFVNRIPNLAAKTAATEHFLERKIFWTRPTRWPQSIKISMQPSASLSQPICNLLLIPYYPRLQLLLCASAATKDIGQLTICLSKPNSPKGDLQPGYPSFLDSALIPFSKCRCTHAACTKSICHFTCAYMTSNEDIPKSKTLPCHREITEAPNSPPLLESSYSATEAAPPIPSHSPLSNYGATMPEG